MSVTVNQRNRAVSLKSIEAITSARAFSYEKRFALPGGLNVVDALVVPSAKIPMQVGGAIRYLTLMAYLQSLPCLLIPAGCLRMCLSL